MSLIAKQVAYLCISLSWFVAAKSQQAMPNIQEVNASSFTTEPESFNLELLQDSFRMAHPQVMEYFSFQNVTPIDLNSEELSAATRCLEMKLSYDQRGILQGEYEDYEFSRALAVGGCTNLTSLQYRVESVITYGKCVRLFYGPSCAGWSLAVFPGSENSQYVLNDKLIVVGSIGPCLPYEFQNASITDPRRHTLSKDSSDRKSYIPDLVEFFSVDKYYRSEKVSISGVPVTHYLLGPHSRVEYLRATVYPWHDTISKYTGNIEESDIYKSLDKKGTDVLCYGIPLQFGGPANETYNVFPASQTTKNEWARITSPFYPPIVAFNISLNFEYENDHATRPLLFYYFINKSGQEVAYGRILN